MCVCWRSPVPGSVIVVKVKSRLKIRKRTGAGERRGGGACMHFLTACSGISTPDIPSDWSIMTVNIIT